MASAARPSMELSQKRLHEALGYDPETGVFTWMKDMKTGRGAGRTHINAGSIAGSVSHKGKGYLKVGIDGRRYYAHRLAFLWMTGEWPKLHIDHIDGDGSNNKWANLRDVPRFMNMQNRKRPTSNSSTGLMGVTKNRKRFLAQITTRGQWGYIGTFDTPEQANQAYLSEKRKLHEGNTL